MATTYRLHSTGLVYTPGFLEWAKVAAESDFWKMVGIIQKGYDLPRWVAVNLLSGKQHYAVDGETVVFEVEDDDGPDEQAAWYDTSKELE